MQHVDCLVPCATCSTTHIDRVGTEQDYISACKVSMRQSLSARLVAEGGHYSFKRKPRYNGFSNENDFPTVYGILHLNREYKKVNTTMLRSIHLFHPRGSPRYASLSPWPSDYKPKKSKTYVFSELDHGTCHKIIESLKRTIRASHALMLVEDHQILSTLRQ